MTHYSDNLTQLGAMRPSRKRPKAPYSNAYPILITTSIMSPASQHRNHLPVPGYRPARFRSYRHRLCPGDWLVESKSLKLFLTAFRNHGAFHEDCTIYIAKRLRDLLEPRWLRIGGFWYPRGGIPIDVFWQMNEPPQAYWSPTSVWRPTGAGVGW